MLAKGYTMKIFTSRPQFDGSCSAFTKLIEDAGKAGVLTMMHCEDRTMNDLAAGAAHRQGPDDHQVLPGGQAGRVRGSRDAAVRGHQRGHRHPHLHRPPVVRAGAPGGRGRAGARRPGVRRDPDPVRAPHARSGSRVPDANIYTGTPPLREQERQGRALEGHGEGLDPRAGHRSRRLHAGRQDGPGREHHQQPVGGQLPAGEHAAALLGGRAHQDASRSSRWWRCLDEPGEALRRSIPRRDDRGRLRRRPRHLGSEPDARR